MPRMQSLEDFFNRFMLSKRYPTSEEIMAKPVKFKRETIAAVKEWKTTFYNSYWKSYSNEAKLAHLYQLVTRLSQLYNKPLCIVHGNKYQYSPLTMTLTLDAENPSIISTLHEFSHHIQRDGGSEKQACRWSIWLFKKVFPKAFAKLQFIPNSHMLCKVQ